VLLSPSCNGRGIFLCYDYVVKRTALNRKTALKRGTKRLARVRKDTVGKLKAQLWHLCRAIIIKQYGNDCYTCPAKGLSGSNLHVGHFISSSVCSAELRYALENLRPQCFACNIHRSGNWPAYESHLRLDGVDVEELKRRNEQTKGMKTDNLWYMAKIAEYEPLVRPVEAIQYAA
jgi:5-methylcytosine-specific restriction endonuclease McrA